MTFSFVKMLTLSTLMLLSAIMTGPVKANIVDIDAYRLPEMVLIKKQDFPYDDVENEGAVMKVNLTAVPQRTLSNQTYSLTIIAADSDTSAQVISILNNGTTRAIDNEYGVSSKNVSWIEDAHD